VAQSFLEGTKESKGVIPPMGVKMRIDEIIRTESKTKKLMYQASFEVIEPDDYSGVILREWFLIGTDTDPKGKKESTWKAVEGGPGRLKRLLIRSGTTVTSDDEEWCADAEGNEVCAHVTVEKDQSGVDRNRINGKFFRENDKEFVGIGVSLEAAGSNGPAAKQKVKAKPAPVADDDEDEDEAPAPKPKAKAAPPPDDDDDEDEVAPLPKKGKPGPKPKVEDDEEDDD
jgi:hypothetical protein